jgi:hypothetical protein
MLPPRGSIAPSPGLGVYSGFPAWNKRKFAKALPAGGVVPSSILTANFKRENRLAINLKSVLNYEKKQVSLDQLIKGAVSSEIGDLTRKEIVFTT